MAHRFLISTFLLLYICLQKSAGLPEVIRVGGLFDNDDESQEVAFINAVNRINANRNILPKSQLVAQVEKITKHDSFEASKRVCNMMAMGVAAIFGPQSSGTSSHVQSICDALEVPHIQTRWDYRVVQDVYSINLYPHSPSLSKAYEDLVRQWGWRTFTILYEDNDGLVRLKDLFKTPARSQFSISVRQLPDSGDDYRDVLREIKKLNQYNIIVDCTTDKVYQVLKQAQQVGMMTEFHHYLVTSIDMDTIDLEDFRHGGTNITSLRLVDPTRPEVIKVVNELQQTERRRQPSSMMGDNKFSLKTETALMFDAVYLFAKALHDLDSSQHIDIKPLSCESESPWVSGNSLINYMKVKYLTNLVSPAHVQVLIRSVTKNLKEHGQDLQDQSSILARSCMILQKYLTDLVQLEGLSGIVGFNTNGFRSDFDLDIMELHRSGLEKIGYWSSRYKDKKLIGLNITKVPEKFEDGSLQSKSLNVTMLLSEPYAMIKESTTPMAGNERFEGYCIDLLDEISKILGFNYTIYEIPDKMHGTRDNVTGEWNGIIREVKDKRADLGIGDITITSLREEAVDFSNPFMTLGISILFRKPTPLAPSLLSFLSPFSSDVWLYMAVTYMGVSVVLFILARLSPYEWDNPHPCIQEPDVLQNDFSILNSMWFTIGSLMQQGSDIAPKAASTRLVAGIWWFFTLIMISSYTANLAAFLTVDNLESPIKDVKDLARQTKIKPGLGKTGSTKTFFETSTNPIYAQLWSSMISGNPNGLARNNQDGMERVKKGDFAFFIESTSNEYMTERHCELTTVGGLLDNKGYGIALPKGSPYRNSISTAILRLQENGILHNLKTKWWKQKKGGGQCKDSKSSTTTSLSLAHVGGIFVVLLSGMGMACIVAVTEFIWKTKKIASYERDSLCREMLKEIIFAVKCKGSKKVAKKLPREPENGLSMPLSKYSLNDREMYS